jgi:hypothetical protein
MQAGIVDRVQKQMECRNDIHSDGEFWKARDELYYNLFVSKLFYLFDTPSPAINRRAHSTSAPCSGGSGSWA